ncbi:MAG TPA: hypothetical protein VFN22_14165 [Gemmatimonadales bacterium]|nr:hypothetical protein [Gemmatimonadales bacterium]
MRATFSLVLLTTLVPVGVHAQAAPLPIGTRGQGSADEATPARFSFSPTTTGLLTIAVSSTVDLGIRVTDVDGQVLPDGTGDVDYAGKPGLEFLTVPLSVVEKVTVEVSSIGGEAGAFTITAGFVAEPAFAVPADPDRRPSLALPLTVGASHTDALAPNSGDRWDWYTITAQDDGTLVFVTRADGEGDPGDVALELYLGDDFSTPTAQSDDDLQDVATNESVTVNVRKGDTVYLKVISLFDSADSFGYRVSVGRVP